MKITKDLNTLSESEFTSIFGNIFEKSDWIAAEAFKLKPFQSYEDLIDKMMKIYESCKKDKIIEILNLHPKLVMDRKLTNFSSKEQSGAKLDKCNQEEFREFEKLNIEYLEKFNFPFIIAVKDKNKKEILQNFKERINNDYKKELEEAKIQVKKIASARLNEILDINI
tara:strand:+ start:431 stop:934 length:504 start_codon:yes stop_codon:yes gene_type:complete